ncbi:MAG: hypothetical protein ABWY93_03255 [Mycobacterium sp.]
MPPVRLLAEERRAHRLRQHAPQLPTLSADDQQIATTIRNDGVHLTTLDALALPGTAHLKVLLEQLVNELAAMPSTASTLRPSRDRMLLDPALWHFGLSDRMLDIAETYLGLPARYYGADVRREVADGAQHDVRQWHRDVEDYRVLKILVWLNDVDTDGGPFAYIPRPRSRELGEILYYVGGFVSDDRMREIEREHRWKLAAGPKWTVVMPDTAQVFHRATPPQVRDRYSVTFTWTSRHPIRTNPKEPFTREQASRIRNGLSSRQLDCLPRALALRP